MPGRGPRMRRACGLFSSGRALSSVSGPAPPSARDRRSLLSAYHGVILAKATSGRDGMFQATLSAPIGSYSLRVVGAVRGHVGSAVTTLRLVPGHIYRVDVRVVRHGSPFFLPVLSY